MVHCFLNKLFCSKFMRKTVYQISSESPEFRRRYYKKNILVSFSTTQCISGKSLQRYIITISTTLAFHK